MEGLGQGYGPVMDHHPAMMDSGTATTTAAGPTSRVLFNLLDKKGVGRVPLQEIERRWKTEAVPNLPGVVDALRAAATPDGTVTFDIFDWALRLAISRAQRRATNENNRRPYGFHQGATRMPQQGSGWHPAGNHDDYASKRDSIYVSYPPLQQQQQTEQQQQQQRALKLARLKQENDAVLRRLTKTNNNNQQQAVAPDNLDQRHKSAEGVAGCEEVETGKGPRRRRTRSGPALTSKIIATLKRTTQRGEKHPAGTDHKTDRPKTTVTKPGAAQYSSSSSGRGSVSPPPHNAVDHQDRSNGLLLDLDRVSSNKLPISLKGKTYIGVTGVPRSWVTGVPRSSPNTPTSSYHPQPKTSTPNDPVTSEVELRHHHNHHHHHRRKREHRFYASCGESGDESHQRHHNRVIMTSSRQQQRSLTPTAVFTNNPPRHQLLRHHQLRHRAQRPKSCDPESSLLLALDSEKREPEDGASDSNNNNNKNKKQQQQQQAKRRSARRYTLSGDIDILQLTRVRRSNRESGALQQSICELDEVIERLRRRLNELTAHVRHLTDGNNGVAESDFELTDEDRLQLLANVVGDLTRISRDLLYPNATDLKSTFKLLKQASGSNAGHEVAQLREQNERMAQLLEDKSGRIKILEQEKILLVQQMFKMKTPSSGGNNQMQQQQQLIHNSSIFI